MLSHNKGTYPVNCVLILYMKEKGMELYEEHSKK